MPLSIHEKEIREYKRFLQLRHKILQKWQMSCFEELHAKLTGQPVKNPRYGFIYLPDGRCKIQPGNSQVIDNTLEDLIEDIDLSDLLEEIPPLSLQEIDNLITEFEKEHYPLRNYLNPRCCFLFGDFYGTGRYQSYH